MFELTGKIALVTGGSRGIGRAICFSLAKQGATVIVNYRANKKAADEVVSIINHNGGEAEAFCADTSCSEDIFKMFDHVKNNYPRLDILVNNAATLSRYPFLELPLEEWDRIMTTNSRGYFICAQQAARMMIKENYGRIINISSISQYQAAAGRTHYCASKGAIGMLSRCMALELAPHNITVNTIAPGSIHTDFNNDVLSNPEYYKKTLDGIPAGRLGVPEDIAGAVVMLASDQASYINGAFIVIDGALTVK